MQVQGYGNGCPCGGCLRCGSPQQCEDKRCRAWRSWFVKQWDETVARLRRKEGSYELEKRGH